MFILSIFLTFPLIDQEIKNTIQYCYIKGFKLRIVSLFSSDLAKGVHARASVERQSREKPRRQPDNK